MIKFYYFHVYVMPKFTSVMIVILPKQCNTFHTSVLSTSVVLVTCVVPPDLDFPPRCLTTTRPTRTHSLGETWSFLINPLEWDSSGKLTTSGHSYTKRICGLDC